MLILNHHHLITAMAPTTIIKLLIYKYPIKRFPVTYTRPVRIMPNEAVINKVIRAEVGRFENMASDDEYS